MSRLCQSLVDGARDLDRGAAVEEVLTQLLTRFDLHCASDPPGYAVAELLRALLAAWREDDEDELWAVSGGDDAA